MSRPVATSGGDARLGGGVELGAVARGEKLAKPDTHKKPAAGGTLPRGGGHGLGTGGKEKPAAPHTRTIPGGKLPRHGGKGLGTSGTEKPDGDEGGPHGATHYADPGYQADSKHRFPIHTESHTRASLRAFNKIKGNYSPKDQTSIGRRLALAAKTHGIDPYENAMRK